ncbi:hypothetical protein RHIZ_20950 [Rhizobium skierniewicense]|uniref:hypothetical protein n=1 Tax=Rhizobium skierniewicense TaxID=984260 RepID=UPI001FABE392|nr:hypothetical protein [Rhizobium skierniewicense]MCI9868438.1 hypothetical protein [Rhizobium skierniewicense]
MRVLFILAATVVVAGGLIATIKVPNVEDNKRILANYRDDPQTTLQRLESAIFQCVPDSAKSATGTRFTKAVIAPFYMKIVDLRMDGAPKDSFSAQIQKWIITNHPELLTSLPDKDFLELVGYLKKIGEDDVENCILSAAMSSDRSVRGGADNWQLRL